jgi:hypothetical protein
MNLDARMGKHWRSQWQTNLDVAQPMFHIQQHTLSLWGQRQLRAGLSWNGFQSVHCGAE